MVFVTATHCRDRNMNKNILKQVRDGMALTTDVFGNFTWRLQRTTKTS